MPVHVKAKTLRRIIKPELTIREESECHVDVSSNTVRLQSRSEAQTVYLDYVIPVPTDQHLSEEMTGSFCLDLRGVHQFLRIAPSSDIGITLPTETRDSTLTLRSGGLTYQFTTLDRRYVDRLFDPPSSNPCSTFSIRHGDFADAVRAADLVDDELQTNVSPKTHQIEFFEASKSTGDSVSYTVSDEQIDTINGSGSRIMTGNEILRDFIAHIPPTSRADFEIHPHHLTYRVNFPVHGAELTLHIAERHGTLREE